MNVCGTEYSLRHYAFEVYLSGCKAPHCSGCHNPKTWEFDYGAPLGGGLFARWQRLLDSTPLRSIIRNVWVLGGEPLDQDHDELVSLLKWWRERGVKVWLFTRYELSDVPDAVRELCDYIKTGRYDATLSTDSHISHGVRLATANQRIHARGQDF